MFFLVLRDGSSLFIEPKPYDFCIHCLFLLIDNPDPRFRGISLLSAPAGCLSLSAFTSFLYSLT